MTLVDFHYVELPPPQTQHVHMQTKGDYTKHVVTPFGTTCLKMLKHNVDNPWIVARQIQSFCM